MRIVYLGFLKTGSRSICSYIKSLMDYDLYIGEAIGLSKTNINIGTHFQLHISDMKKSFFNGCVDNSSVYDILKNNENFVSREFPYFGMYQYIYENYDDSKFILCIRNLEDIFNSYKNYMSKRIAYSINEALLDVYRPITDEDKEKFIEIYEEHNQKILDFFKDKPGKLLVLKFEDFGTENFKRQIQDFLGKYNHNLEMKNLKTPNETI